MALASALVLAGVEEPATFEVTHVGTVAPDIIGVTVRAGRTEYGGQVPYERVDGDKVIEQEVHRWVVLDGKVIGSLVGADANTLQTLDSFVRRRLDTGWADQRENYTVTSPDDAAYEDGRIPAALHRKSKPTDLARAGMSQVGASMEHVLHLHLPEPLTPGKRYLIRF